MPSRMLLYNNILLRDKASNIPKQLAEVEDTFIRSAYARRRPQQ